jgi:FtsP/CotA-like multicopper oxidase with cupredoxin domain
MENLREKALGNKEKPMKRRKVTPWRLAILLIMACLAIGFALAQSQGVGQPPADTPKSVAPMPAGMSDGTAQVSAVEPKEESANETLIAANDAEAEAAGATREAEAVAQEAVNGRTVSRMRSTTQAQRKQAAKNFARRAAQVQGGAVQPQAGSVPCNFPLGTPCVQVNYFTPTPNYAVSKLPTLTQTSIDPAEPKTYTVTAGTGIKKFVDTLPGLGPANKNNLLNYLPIATPMANPWGTGGDYYEISLIGYTQQFHTNLPATTQVRGYVDLNPAPLAAFRTLGDTGGHYLGPVIIAQRDRPVRIKFTNNLVANSFLFIPADASYMGMNHMGVANYAYSKNRATLHLHGGATPWISDGTPHQWTIPVGEAISPLAQGTRGASVQFVPDMWFNTLTHVAQAKSAATSNDPGNGSLSFFWSNAQSGRLMFYHDHAYGITRLNVYAGEAAGYLLHDPIVDALIGTSIPNNAGVDLTSTANLTAAGLNVPGGLYHYGIPLVIQDKTFVPPQAQLTAQDPSWNWGNEGNFWFPHVYMTNQNPNDNSGASIAGRWDYGMWFWPPMTVGQDLAHGAITCLGAGDIAAFGPTALCPGTLNPSGVPESFMDTPLVNGQAYPTVTLPTGAYRFQILNAANDRMFNLSMFYAADANGTVCNPNYAGTLNNLGQVNATAYAAGNLGTNFANCTEVKMVPAAPHPLVQTPTYVLPPPEAPADTDDTLPACAQDSTHPDVIRGSGFLVTANPLAIDYNANTGLPGLSRACWPSSWPTDGRDGGVPDPASAGPPWVQIGTEGGVLPAPVVIPATPVGYNYNRRDVVVTNVQEHAVFLGPAERADVIVDLSQVPQGATLMLYNDSPAPVPGYDTRLDYYTGDPDQTDTGGAPITQPGYGPNIRTIMQIHVTGTGTSSYTLATLQSQLPTVFYQTQPKIIIPEPTYSAAALGGAPPTVGNYARIQNVTSMTYTPTGGVQTTTPVLNKAIHELFEAEYGKMNSILAAELPLTNYNNQTTIPLAYVDPPTEFVAPGQTEIWKVTHNGVDSHAIHFHLFNVQLINRVGWDGAIRPPDPNELGWKETVRMNPLEDAYVALQPIQPPIPFAIPDSNRLLDPSRDLGATNTSAQQGFSNNDPVTGNQVTTVNVVQNFGWEYVWHCHLLGHEEEDMMRPMVFQVPAPSAPFNLAGTLSGSSVNLTWQYTAAPGSPVATGFMIQRATGAGAFATLPAAASLLATPLSFTDTTAVFGVTYSYKVFAIAGAAISGPSNTFTIVDPASPTNLRRTAQVVGSVSLAWNAPVPTTGETGYVLSRCTGSAAACALPTATWTQIAPPPALSIGTLTFTNTGLGATGTVYQYRVQATGPGGPFGFSNILQVTAL